jgi:hypothetical protein
MNVNTMILRSSAFVALIFLTTLVKVPLAHAATGLCPSGFNEGIVTTGFVECDDSSSARIDRADAEFDRIVLEAICLSEPRSSVSNSQIMVTGSGRFFAEVTCTIQRVVPSGTVLCPTDAEEILRAFDTLICEYFGTAETTLQQATTTLNQQNSECTSLSGSVLESSINSVDVPADTFFSTSLVCALDTLTTDNLVCPFGFDEIFETVDEILCVRTDRSFETIEEAEQENQVAQNICTDTTAGLGSVTEILLGVTSVPSFFSTVECTITKPRYGEFSDSRTIRACDASCTEEIEQSRQCLNGGVIGGPGCSASSTQTVERRCNTGVDRNGLCPLMHVVPSILLPLLLDEEDP